MNILLLAPWVNCSKIPQSDKLKILTVSVLKPRSLTSSVGSLWILRQNPELPLPSLLGFAWISDFPCLPMHRSDPWSSEGILPASSHRLPSVHVCLCVHDSLRLFSSGHQWYWMSAYTNNLTLIWLLLWRPCCQIRSCSEVRGVRPPTYLLQGYCLTHNNYEVI